jgi:hypothetical protein
MSEETLDQGSATDTVVAVLKGPDGEVKQEEKADD